MIDTFRIDHLVVQHASPKTVTRTPVLFVHGYLADATVWRDWLPFFAERGFPAFAVNLRGRGGSAMGTFGDGDLGRASVEDFVDDADRVARAIAERTGAVPAVIGHSMGGLIAQRLAAAGVVRAAVLVASAPPRGITVLSPRVAIKQLKYLPAIFRSRLVHAGREEMREIVLNHVPKDEQDAILDALVPDSGRAAREMSFAGVPVDATAINVPMLVIAADDDLFVPNAVAVRIAKRYGVPIQTFAGRGHMLIMEPEWEAIADTAARWLTSV